MKISFHEKVTIFRVYVSLNDGKFLEIPPKQYF